MIFFKQQNNNKTFVHEYKCMLEQKKAPKHADNDVFLMLPSSRGGTDGLTQ